MLTPSTTSTFTDSLFGEEKIHPHQQTHLSIPANGPVKMLVPPGNTTSHAPVHILSASCPIDLNVLVLFSPLQFLSSKTDCAIETREI